MSLAFWKRPKRNTTEIYGIFKCPPKMVKQLPWLIISSCRPQIHNIWDPSNVSGLNYLSNGND